MYEIHGVIQNEIRGEIRDEIHEENLGGEVK